MAKEFKDFDKKYKHLAGTALKTLEADGQSIQPSAIAEVECWEHLVDFTEEYSTSTVLYAVYEAAGAEEWQKFRVSLKGLSTREKLYALEWYWAVHIDVGAGSYPTVNDWSRQLIRVNNYISALKRGGQLDSQLRVIKG